MFRLRRVVWPIPDKLNRVWEVLGTRFSKVREMRALNCEFTVVVATTSNLVELACLISIVSPVSSAPHPMRGKRKNEKAKVMVRARIIFGLEWFNVRKGSP